MRALTGLLWGLFPPERPHAALRGDRGRASSAGRRPRSPPWVCTSGPTDEELLVIAEEFGNWEDARRRIDLLALDKAGRLVVIELKRTDDGGHMELQAIRYAAMVSAMGFAEVADANAAHRAKRLGETLTARAELAAFLEAGEGEEEPVISTDVRIILARSRCAATPKGASALPFRGCLRAVQQPDEGCVVPLLSGWLLLSPPPDSRRSLD